MMGDSSSRLMNSMRERFLAMTRSVSLRSLMVEGRCFLLLSVAIRDNVASSSLEEDFLMVEMEGRSRRIGGDVRKCLAGLSDGVRRRLVICQYIWPHMLAMALTYTVTLSLYPGVETLIQSCSLAHWITIILMVTFNITDLVGKVMAGLRKRTSPSAGRAKGRINATAPPTLHAAA